MRFKSDTCFSRVGEPVNAYKHRSEAASHAAIIRREHGTALAPYACERCGYWHLALTDRITPSSVCKVCKGSDGQSKDLYRTRNDAQRRADILRRESGVSLRVYACPSEGGWHLTKS